MTGLLVVVARVATALAALMHAAVNVQQSNIGLVMLGETAGQTRQATRQLAINEAEKKLKCKVRQKKEATNSFTMTLQ